MLKFKPKAHSPSSTGRSRFSKLTIFLGLSIAATIIAIVISFATAFGYLSHGVSYELDFAGDISQLRQVYLFADYRSVDAKAGTLTVDWYPQIPDITDCSQSPEIVSFYFDPNVQVSSDQDKKDETPSDGIETKATFQFNTTCLQDRDFRSSFPTFQTTTKLTMNNTMTPQDRRLIPRSLQAYPFDTYFSQISVFALLNSTNETVAIISGEPSGDPINFKLKLNSASQSSSEVLYIVLDIARSQPVKVLACIIVIANWSVTIAFIFITIAGMVWPEDVVKEVFVIPVATLFAFTAVRTNLPGAPEGFGAFIDYVGILPNLTILTLCGAVLLAVVLARRIHQELKKRLGPEGKLDSEAQTPELHETNRGAYFGAAAVDRNSG